MKIIALVLTVAHVVAAVAALVAGLAAMLLPKAGLWHRRTGTAYFWAMAVVACSAVVLSIVHPNLFVGLATVFSFYFAFAGYCTWTQSRVDLRPRGTALNWAAILVMACSSAGFLVLWSQGAGPGNSGTSAAVFSLVGFAVAGHDGARLQSHSVLQPASIRHLHAGIMVSAFAATILGFYAGFLPAPWDWPVAVVTPYALVIGWSLLRRPVQIDPR